MASDKEIRLKILQVLHEANKSKPGSYSDRAVFKEKLQLEGAELDSNILYLEEKGYVKLLKGIGSNFFSAKITSNGIDFVDESATSGDISRRKVFVFISYSHENKNLASNVKAGLEKFGFEAFLAHEDIEPSSEFQEEILKQLVTCDVFIPILTNEFLKSNWTDQETGIAFTRGKVILPLSLGLTPYGFIARFQALKIDETKISETCEAVVKAIQSRAPDLKEKIQNSLIENFAESPSFLDAASRSRALEKCGELSKNQLDRIIEAAVTNDQIYNSGPARKPLTRFFKKHENLIEPDKWAKLKGVFDSIL